MLLPDINIWLALAFEAHCHHVRAREWFDTCRAGTCAFCRLTQQGFLRLATNPAVFGVGAVSLPRAWSIYDVLLEDERNLFLAESEGLEGPWRIRTRDRGYSHKVWSDAYLVAFAECVGARIVTFDRGFRDYSGTNPIVLTSL